jgi:DNA-directed RNA polymerase subunit L
MKSVVIREKKENFLHLQIRNNNIKPSLINSLRRVILGEIPVYAPDPESYDFIKNSTILDNGFLTTRLNLIPINYEGLQEYLTRGTIDDFEIYYNETNNSDIIMKVYVGDFTFRFKGDVIPGEKVVVQQKILFSKMKSGETLTFSAKLKQSTVLKDGPGFMSVSQATYTFERDPKAIQKYIKEHDLNEEEKKNFLLSEADRLYLKTKTNEPQLYNFKLRTNDNINPSTVFLQGIDVLKTKLKILDNALEKNLKEKVELVKADTSYQAFDFNIFDEDDTLGNLIDTYLELNTKIRANGYVIPHPFDNLLVIRTQLKSSNTLKNNEKVFRTVIDFIHKLLLKLETDFRKSTPKIKVKISKQEIEIEDDEETVEHDEEALQEEEVEEFEEETPTDEEASEDTEIDDQDEDKDEDEET